MKQFILFAISLFLTIACVKKENDPCVGITCLNLGQCVNGACECPEPWTGSDCSILTDSCYGVICLNDGKCVSGNCDCTERWTGVDCGTQKTPSQISVTKIIIHHFPSTNRGVSWDTASGADIYITLSMSGTTLFKAPITYENANPDSSYEFVITPPVNVTDLERLFFTTLYDEDFLGDTYMLSSGTYLYFDHNKFPPILQKRTSSLEYDIYVDYSFW